MDYSDLILKNRSYRRFDETVEITQDEMLKLVNWARLTPSAANAQVLKYKISYSKEENNKIFPHLKWAAALPDWDGPKEGERPSGYIIMVSDLTIGSNRKQDEGIAAQTIMLGAVSLGYGGCIMGAIDREKLYTALELNPEQYRIELVLALGKPKEEVVITDLEPDGSTKYYRKNNVHYVPKRKLEDSLI